jgi:NitT/TauT family transport system permease protein
MKQRLGLGFMLVSVLLIWWLCRCLSSLPPLLLPGPALVLENLWTERAIYAHHATISVGICLLGYFISNVVAIGLAVVLIYFPKSDFFINPWVVLLKNIPFVSLASILAVTLGDGLPAKLIVIVLVCFFPILANLYKGLLSADPLLLDRMQVLQASTWQIFWKVRWRCALPFYMAAHEIALTSSIVATIIAEWFFTNEGLGYLMVRAVNDYRGDRLYALTVITSVLSLIAYQLCRSGERWVMRWKR